MHIAELDIQEAERLQLPGGGQGAGIDRLEPGFCGQQFHGFARCLVVGRDKGLQRQTGQLEVPGIVLGEDRIEAFTTDAPGTSAATASAADVVVPSCKAEKSSVTGLDTSMTILPVKSA